MENNQNRHAALALLQSVIDGAKQYGECSTTMRDPFSCSGIWYKNVSKIVISRGLTFLLSDLPKIGKDYDSALSSGVFPIEKYESGIKGVTFRYLLSDTFDLTTGELHTCDPNVVFFTRQLLYLFKDLEIDCPVENIHKTVQKFIDVERELREPSGSWHSDVLSQKRFRFMDDPVLVDSHPRSRKLWGIVDLVFSRLIPTKEIDVLTLRPKHGPGAVADMKSGGDKYSFPHWPSKLDATFPWCAFAQHREDFHITEEVTSTLSVEEPPAQLIAVPKSFDAPRLIASEPIAHQFLQQALMSWMRTNLHPSLRISIDFLSQEPSREAALAASKNGHLATVDLSSASDRLSCWTVERAFGSNLSILRALHAVRTRRIVDATNTHPELNLLMKKFAAQGSAVTFPVQTIVYTGLCIAAYLFCENLSPTARNINRAARKVRVYGDDIILPRICVPILTLMLDSLQLKVNAQKTHTDGAFRESCGMDAWRGYDVTPCYLHTIEWDTSPQSQVSYLDVSNNAFRKGLWQLAELLDEGVPLVIAKRTLTTRADGDGFRRFTFVPGYRTTGRVRMCQHLHKDMVKLITVSPLLSVKQRGSWQDFYQFLIERPQPHTKWSSGYLTKKRLLLKSRWVAVD